MELDSVWFRNTNIISVFRNGILASTTCSPLNKLKSTYLELELDWCKLQSCLKSFNVCCFSSFSPPLLKNQVDSHTFCWIYLTQRARLLSFYGSRTPISFPYHICAIQPSQKRGDFKYLLQHTHTQHTQKKKKNPFLPEALRREAQKALGQPCLVKFSKRL